MDVLLRIPEFPQTEQDAEKILRYVRSYRDECELTKEAAELSVHRCILQLQILQEHTMDTNDLTILGLFALERRREALTQAAEALTEADDRVGTIRTLLRRKALPLSFPHDAEFRGFPPKRHPPVHTDYRSDDSEHSVAGVSDLEVGGDM